MTWALVEPSPKTVCVAAFHSSQARQVEAARLTAANVARGGTRSAARAATESVESCSVIRRLFLEVDSPVRMLLDNNLALSFARTPTSDGYSHRTAIPSATHCKRGLEIMYFARRSFPLRHDDRWQWRHARCRCARKYLWLHLQRTEYSQQEQPTIAVRHPRLLCRSCRPRAKKDRSTSHEHRLPPTSFRGHSTSPIADVPTFAGLAQQWNSGQAQPFARLPETVPSR